MASADQVRGGTGRSATTLELFFDLVYVFAITQVVGLVHADPTLGGLAQGALLLAILWWTWSIYTWTTNWSGTDTDGVKLFLLTAMGATLVMAAAVPEAFGERSELFGVTLFAVRALVAALYWFESKNYEVQRAAFFTFFPLSFGAALIYLIGGFLDGGWVVVAFAVGAALDIISALNAGKGVWAVDGPHFAERNGLFVIIALGESVVGVGFVVADVPLDTIHVTPLVVAFAGVAALWWAYFDRAAPAAEQHFGRLSGQAPGRFARDAYTLIHYPLVVGIVFFAVALEEVVAHPEESLTVEARFALAGGAALVLLSVAAMTYRAIRRLTPERVIVAALLLLLVFLGGVSALTFAVVTVALTVGALAVERARPWPEPGIVTESDSTLPPAEDS